MGFFKIPLIGGDCDASIFADKGFLTGGGGSKGGATLSRGDGAGRARQNARGIKVYVESIAVISENHRNKTGMNPSQISILL